MNFNENDLWSDKMSLRLSKLPSAKSLLKLEFDTEDQVLFISLLISLLIREGLKKIKVGLKESVKCFPLLRAGCGRSQL